MGAMSVAAADWRSAVSSAGEAAPTAGSAGRVLLLAMKTVLLSTSFRLVTPPKASRPWPVVRITSQSSFASLAVRCAMRASSWPTAVAVSETARW
ncbi:hypothetical protein D3C85_884180 [compost metagenome]